MNRIPLAFCFALSMVSISPPAASLSQEISADNVIKKTQRVQFTDANGKPIAGVVVRPFGLNSSYFWPEQVMGAPSKQTSDAEGFITLEYPERFADSVLCKSIDFSTNHEKYVGTIERLGVVAPEIAKVVLKKGIRIRVAAVDEDGEPVVEKYAAMVSGDSAPERWQRLDDGSISTESIGQGNYQMILVQPRENGKTRFSEPLFYHFDQSNLEEGVEIDDVELVEGVRVYGEFPRHIPRPIRNGVVIANQFPMPVANANEVGVELVNWADWTEVKEDGTFEFASLPRSGQIQVIALCDGWVSPGKHIFTNGQEFQIHDEDRLVELEFVRTVRAAFTVRDRQGNPIPKAMISCNPNQLWKDRGSQILGERYRTIDQAKAILGFTEPNTPRRTAFENFMSPTDNDGVAKILNVPIYYAGREVTIQKKGYKTVEREVEEKDIVDKGSVDEQPSLEYEVILDAEDPE